MNGEEVQGMLAKLAAHPGIQGCALADAASGMVYFHDGKVPNMESTAEAGIDLWRVHARHPSQFAPLGPLQSAAFAFAQNVLALFPCTPSGLVLVCVAGKGQIDWGRWGELVQELKTHLA